MTEQVTIEIRGQMELMTDLFLEGCEGMDIEVISGARLDDVLAHLVREGLALTRKESLGSVAVLTDKGFYYCEEYLGMEG